MSKKRSQRTQNYLRRYLWRVPYLLLSETGSKFLEESGIEGTNLHRPFKPDLEFDKVISHIRRNDLSEEGKKWRREAIRRLEKRNEEERRLAVPDSMSIQIIYYIPPDRTISEWYRGVRI